MKILTFEGDTIDLLGQLFKVKELDETFVDTI